MPADLIAAPRLASAAWSLECETAEVIDQLPKRVAHLWNGPFTGSLVLAWCDASTFRTTSWMTKADPIRPNWPRWVAWVGPNGFAPKIVSSPRPDNTPKVPPNHCEWLGDCYTGRFDNFRCPKGQHPRTNRSDALDHATVQNLAPGGRRNTCGQEDHYSIQTDGPGGQATPRPPLGPVLGANGVNPGQFITQFNDATRELNGKLVGCVVTVFEDRSFELEIKARPLRP